MGKSSSFDDWQLASRDSPVLESSGEDERPTKRISPGPPFDVKDALPQTVVDVPKDGPTAEGKNQEGPMVTGDAPQEASPPPTSPSRAVPPPPDKKRHKRGLRMLIRVTRRRVIPLQILLFFALLGAALMHAKLLHDRIMVLESKVGELNDFTDLLLTEQRHLAQSLRSLEFSRPHVRAPSDSDLLDLTSLRSEVKDLQEQAQGSLRNVACVLRALTAPSKFQAALASEDEECRGPLRDYLPKGHPAVTMFETEGKERVRVVVAKEGKKVHPVKYVIRRIRRGGRRVTRGLKALFKRVAGGQQRRKEGEL